LVEARDEVELVAVVEGKDEELDVVREEDGLDDDESDPKVGAERESFPQPGGSWRGRFPACPSAGPVGLGRLFCPLESVKGVEQLARAS